MGKRYYCEYCDKMMVSTPSIVKIHNKGIAHQKLVEEHYQQFKDPETILAEEQNKKPCSRSAQGSCHFGSICRFSHYTKEQLDALKEYVTRKNSSEQDLTPTSFQALYQKLQSEKSGESGVSATKTILIDKNGVTHILPWAYNRVFESYSKELPPSIRKFKLEDFNEAEIMEWG